MELSDTLKTLLRRWYILLLGLLMTAGLGLAVYRAVPTTYEATGSVLLMPAKTMVGEEGNPYLYLGGMRDVLDVLVRRSDSEQIREATLSRFVGADYSVASDATTQSPIVVVTAQSPSPDDSAALLQMALAVVARNLGAMQDELAIPDGSRIQMRELVVDFSPNANTRTANQAAIATLGAGLLGTLLVTGFVDSLLLGRRGRRILAGNKEGDTEAWSTDQDLAPATTPPTEEGLPEGESDRVPSSPEGDAVVGGQNESPGAGSGNPADSDTPKRP